MKCAAHVMYHAPNIGIYEFSALRKLRRLSVSSSSGIDPSASQVVSSIGNGASDVTSISGQSSGNDNR